MIIPALLMLTSSAFASSFAMKLALTETNPEPGDAISLEVRLTNTASTPVQIPADWTERLKMLAWREPPGQRPTPRQLENVLEARLLQARQMKWITVEPNQTLSHTLPLTIEECASGCIGGSYYGQVMLEWNLVDGAKPNQETPKSAVSFNFDVRLPTTDVTTGVTAMVASLSPPTEAGDLAGVLTLRNDTGAPLWLANPEHWRAGCEILDKKGNNIGLSAIAGGQGPLRTEDGYTLLPAAATQEVPFSCPGIVQGKLPGKSTLTVSAQADATFFPLASHADRAVLTGTITSGMPTPIPRK